ncbi:MAG: hypothetical protein AAGK32_21825, partial [Actinomycetota bacterium]
MRTVGALLALSLAVAACSADDADPETGESADPAGFVDPGVATERVDAYLDAVTDDPLDPSSPLGAIAHLERAARDDDFEVDAEAVTPDAYAERFAKIDGFEDTSDFDLLYMINLWYGYRDQLPADTMEAFEERFLAYKYWYTEPTPDGVVDNKYYWSENHRIIFHTLEFLAGQAFPDQTFTNDGRSGAEHRDEARERILEWIDEKVRFGFSEWHSDVY